MKFIALTILVVLAGAYADDSNELTSSEERFFQDLMHNYKGQVKEYVRENLKELAEAVCEDKTTNLEGPFNEVIERAEEIDEESETVCGLIKNHLVYVLDPLVKALDHCLPNEEAGIFTFGVKAITSLFAYLCESNGEHILELVNPCIEDIDLENSKCIDKALDKWNEITSTSTKSFKEEACGEYSDVRPCLVGEIHSKCKLPITQEAIVGLIDSIFQKPCVA